MKPLFYIDPKELPTFPYEGQSTDNIYVTNDPNLDDCTLPVYSGTDVTLLQHNYNQLQLELVKRDEALDLILEQRDTFYNSNILLREEIEKLKTKEREKI